MAAGGRRISSKDNPQDNARLLGIHIRTAGGLMSGARHAVEIGCTTFQIMSGNPSAWNPGSLDERQALQFRDFLDAHSLRPVFLHAGYLINLSCRTGRNAPLYAKSVKLAIDTIERARALSCEYVVMHMGSRRGISADAALTAFTDGIIRMDKAVNSGGAGRKKSQGLEGSVMLLLENSAGAGDTVGSTFEELAEVLAAAEERGVRLPLGICLDTAHLWGAGYDLRSGAAARRAIDDFDRVVGIDRLHLIHLNDSPLELGAKRDKHEHPGCGLIPIKGLEGLARDRRLRAVAMIMETPGGTDPSDTQRMDDLRALAGV